MPSTNREVLRKKERKQEQKRREVIKTHLENNNCKDCGEDDLRVLEFDHLGDKLFSMAKIVYRTSPAKIREEIAKCDVVCANCHRKRTYGRLDSCWRISKV